MNMYMEVQKCLSSKLLCDLYSLKDFSCIDTMCYQ